ncbi:MAG TPA: hypothetical protein VM513_01030 [Kofleriaceae bacterium]|nr:hypothetical protein [Kofleriaceae bacterium]
MAFLIASFVAGCSGGSETGDDTDGDDDGGGGGDGDGGDPLDGGPDIDDDDTAPTYPTQHPRIYLGPNKARLQASLQANGPAASRFKQSVDQWVSGADLWGFHAWNAALMGALTGTQAYCTKAIADVDAQVTAAEARIASNQAPAVAGDSYLGVGHMIGDVALVYDWCFDAVSASQRMRWINYANQAVSNVWNPTTAKWGTATIPWTGWSVNNPSNNYYYSFLRATMLLGLATKGENPNADQWITQFRDTKIMGQLVPAFTADLIGGGSREGTGYGTAMRDLFELYDWWHATTGEKLHTKTSHARQSLRAFVHQMVPTLDRFAPTGDQSRDATAALFDYQRAYLQVLIKLFPDDPMAGPAKQMLASSSVPQMSQAFMRVSDFLYDNAEVQAKPADALNTTYYAPGIGQVYTRSGWDKGATWLNLIGGPYTESHAHQDQGSLMLYKGGWLVYDAVVESHSGIDQEVTTHSLVRIDSGGQKVKQIASTMSKLEALKTGNKWTYAAADVTAAYKGNAAVQLVQREVVHLKPDVVVVFDRVKSASGTTQTWQLAVPTAPSINGNTATISNAGHQLKVTRVGGGNAYSTYDYRGGSDFNGGFRLDEAQAGGDQRYLHVLAIDGSALGITAAGDSAHPGATIQLAGGGTATVTFNRDTVGATLTMDGQTTNLAAGVANLAD